MNKLALLTAGFLVLSLAGCAQAEQLARDAISVAGTTQADWSTDASQYRGRDGSYYAYNCPSNGSAGSLWGTNPYTDDSSVCTAGVHAGAITLARGGRMVIQITPGQDRYASSSSNGVTSRDYPAWGGSFRVVN
jgi:hypothetical protein